MGITRSEKWSAFAIVLAVIGLLIIPTFWINHGIPPNHDNDWWAIKGAEVLRPKIRAYVEASTSGPPEQKETKARELVQTLRDLRHKGEINQIYLNSVAFHGYVPGDVLQKFGPDLVGSKYLGHR